MAAFIVLWILFAIIGEVVGENKGRSGAGFALGILLGPIGIIIVALMGRTPEAEAAFRQKVGQVTSSPTERDCPWCAEPIQRAAIVCKHCTRDVETGQLA